MKYPYLIFVKILSFFLYQGKFAVLSVASGLAVYFLSEKGEYRCLWLAGALSMLSALPWTRFIMMPDINQLKEKDILERKGKTHTL